MILAPKISAILLLVLGFALISCTKEDEVICDIPLPVAPDSSLVTLEFNATTNSVPLELLKSFNDPLGRELQVEMLKFYVSNVYVHSGTTSTLVHEVALIILEDPNVLDTNDRFHKIEMQVPVGIYDKISFSIGLDPVQNKENPNDYTSEHPLSISQNTYWDSWTNYKFFMIEGKGDWDGDGFLTNIYGYHTGFDVCYREVSINTLIESSPDENAKDYINLTFEVNDVFFGQDTVNMEIHPTWHGDTSTIETALILSDNLQNAIKLE